MMQVNRQSRNEEILSVLNQAVPMLHSLACQFDLEYDELYQMAAIAAIENYEKAQAAENPHAFLYGVVRNVLWYKPKDEATVSLNRPLNTERGVTLADLLEASQQPQVDTKREGKKTRALYASLRKLPLEVQLYIARVHDLNAYRPARPRKGRFAGRRPNFTCDPGTLSRQAYHYLRHDRRLASVICGIPIERKLDFERDFTLW